MSRWILILVVIIAQRCSQGNQGTPSPAVVLTADRAIDERLIILQAIKPHLTDLFQRARAEEVCFVSFGATTGGNQSDPPRDCLNMLEGMRRSVVVASSGQNRDSEYIDKVTGKAGILVSIVFDKRNDNEFVVSLGFRRSGLDGFGFKVRVIRDADRWVARDMFDNWVS